MASKKHKTSKADSEIAQDDAFNGKIEDVQITSMTAESVSDTRWIMREAAWVRMFGRIEAKNPFAR